VNPPSDFASIYDADYYKGRGADPLTDYESEMTNPRTTRTYEWRGILRVVQALHPIERTTQWLDLGCGLGGLVRFLRESGFEGAVGCEDGYARTRAQDFGVPCVTTADLREHEGSFDVITSIEVLEHVADPLPVLHTIERLLRPGGVFFFTTGNAEPHRDRLLDWSYVIPEIHVSFYEPVTMDRALARVGLDVEHHGFVPGFDDIIRYKVVKNLPRRVGPAVNRLVPWRWAAPLVDRRYGVSAFSIGRKPRPRPA
jgi:SAM-dependent methyltransferase